MKLLQVFIALGGTAYAVSALAEPIEIPRDIVFPALTTTTVYATSVYTVVKCAADNTECPEEATAVVTAVIPLTTTICPFTSGASSLTISIPTGRQTSRSSLTAPGSPPGVPTSTFVTYSTVVLTPVPSSASSEQDVPTGSISSATERLTYNPTGPILPDTSLTNTEGILTSFKPSQSYATSPLVTSGSSTLPSGPNVPTTPGVSPSGSAHSTSTDAIPTSVHASSAGYITPPVPSLGLTSSSAGQDITPTPGSSAVSSSVGDTTLPTPSIGTDTSTSATSTDAALTSIKPSLPLNSTTPSGTTHVTSALTQTLTSIVTSPRGSATTSVVEGTSTSSGTAIASPSYPVIPTLSFAPTGPANSTFTPSTKLQGQPTNPAGSSGYPQPSQNGTWPSPTIPVVPINDGSRTVGKSSTAAIVLALAFTLENPWVSLVLGLDVVAAAQEDTMSGWVAPNPGGKLLMIEQVLITFLIFATFLHFLRYVKSHALIPVVPPHKEDIDRVLAERADDIAEIEYYCALHDKIIRRSDNTGSRTTD